MKYITRSLAVLICIFMIGCASKRQPYDYTAFKNSRPKSILILPPINNTVDIKGTYSFYANATKPLGEAGYYVFPVAMVDELFKENGYTNPNDIHTIPSGKLREIFQADVALYLVIKDFGTKYAVVSSATVVTVEGTLVDLRSGSTIWSGRATASSEEGKDNNQGLAVAMLSAIISQVASNFIDQGHKIGKITSQRLLSGGVNNGVLFGPRHSLYMTESK